MPTIVAIFVRAFEGPYKALKSRERTPVEPWWSMVSTSGSLQLETGLPGLTWGRQATQMSARFAITLRRRLRGSLARTIPQAGA